MTGMPYPYAVEVGRRGDPQVLRGCGGEPATLLQRNQWQVASINSVDVPADARATLVFGDDGRVAGRAFCNSYAGTYVLTGEGLGFAQGATTMMACAEPLTSLEASFFAVLGKLQRFEITPQGALVLHASDGGNMTAAPAAR